MTNDFRSCNVIYIVYDRKNENHWSLLVIRYSLLIYSEYKPLFHDPCSNGSDPVHTGPDRIRLVSTSSSVSLRSYLLLPLFL